MMNLSVALDDLEREKRLDALWEARDNARYRYVGEKICLECGDVFDNAYVKDNEERCPACGGDYFTDTAKCACGEIIADGEEYCESCVKKMGDAINEPLRKIFEYLEYYDFIGLLLRVAEKMS